MSLTKAELDSESPEFREAYAIVTSGDRSNDALSKLQAIQGRLSGADTDNVSRLIEAFLVDGGIEADLQR
jgi:hypothetical protein